MTLDCKEPKNISEHIRLWVFMRRLLRKSNFVDKLRKEGFPSINNLISQERYSSKEYFVVYITFDKDIRKLIWRCLIGVLRVMLLIK